MSEDQTHPLERFVEWMNAEREAAEPLLSELLALPDAEWDAWLESHPEARIVALFEGLLHVAEEDSSRALAVSDFVVRHVDSLIVPAEGALAHTIVRGDAWRVRALALAAGALEASAAIFREVPVLRPELQAVEEAVRALRQSRIDPPLTAGDERRARELIEKNGWYHLIEKP